MTLFSEAFLWILDNQRAFTRALSEHLIMSGSALAIALVIALPLAVAIVSRPRIASVAIGAVNAVRTVPSLAILALMLPLLGIGLWPSVVALTVLALPPILINAYVGLRDVDPDAVEAATGMGMTRGEILRKIRLPLAAPAMFAGLRTACVQVLAGATLAPFIGGGGLGDFIAVGIGMMDTSRLLVGAVPIALLALTTELVLELAERFLTVRRTAA